MGGGGENYRNDTVVYENIQELPHVDYNGHGYRRNYHCLMMRIGVEGGNSTASGEEQAGGDSGQQKHGSMEKLLVNGLGDCKLAAAVRCAALQVKIGRSLKPFLVDGSDYDSILGQCCEMPVGYVQVPVGIAGPLLLDGRVVFDADGDDRGMPGGEHEQGLQGDLHGFRLAEKGGFM
ncbi:hypothetical protein AAC387_Pa05g2365 [Persea americana]